MENKIEEKRHADVVYKLYDYLKRNHLGHENGVKKSVLAEKFGISERELRGITKEINASLDFDKLVSTTHCCYMCNTKKECEKSIRNTFRVAVALIKKGNVMAKKVSLNGQIKIGLGEEYQDFIDTFSKEE